MDLVDELFPTRKSRKVDTPFQTDSKFEKELIAGVSLVGNVLHKLEMECHGKFGHTLFQIEEIYIMSLLIFATHPSAF